MNNPLYAIQFFRNEEKTQYSANPVIKGRMYWLPPQPSFKTAYKKAMSFMRFIRREEIKV